MMRCLAILAMLLWNAPAVPRACACCTPEPLAATLSCSTSDSTSASSCCATITPAAPRPAAPAASGSCCSGGRSAATTANECATAPACAEPAPDTCGDAATPACAAAAAEPEPGCSACTFCPCPGPSEAPPPAPATVPAGGHVDAAFSSPALPWEAACVDCGDLRPVRDATDLLLETRQQHRARLAVWLI